MSTPTPDDWEALRSTIEDRYVHQSQTISQIRDLLHQQDYRVSERAVRTRVERWGLHKNIREREILTALDLLLEAHANGGSIDAKVAIRKKIVGFHEIALRLRNRGIPDPWEWRRTHSRGGFTPSPHVRLIAASLESRPERVGHRIQSQGSVPIGDVIAGSGSGHVTQMQELSHLPAAVDLDALEKQILPTASYDPLSLLAYTDQDHNVAEGFYHLRNYCWDYLQTKRSASHVEPAVHQQTVHGKFGDRMQDGLALFKRSHWDEAFWVFGKGCALIGPLLEDDHPMSLSLLLAVICELTAHNAAVVVHSVLNQAVEMCTLKAGKSASLQKLLESLLRCSDFAWYACQYACIFLDVFEADNPFRWKTLYVKERLCDCMYHCARFEAGSFKRSSLLLQQENFYGKNARNVLWTLTNVADDRLNAGDYQGAVKSFQSAFNRAKNIHGFGRAKVQFAAREGLAKANLAEAVRLSLRLQEEEEEEEEEEEMRLQRDECLQNAVRHIDEAIDIGVIWFDLSSRRIARALDLKARIENSRCS